MTGVIVAIAAIAAVALAAVVGGGIGLAVALGGHGSRTPLARGGAHSGDMPDYLVSAPSGSTSCDGAPGADEALSLDQAAQLSFAGDDVRMAEYGYESGAVRCWKTNSELDTYEVIIYQFSSAGHAEDLFTFWVDNTRGTYASETEADVPGVPGGKSFTNPALGHPSFMTLAYGLRGDVVLVVGALESGKASDVPGQLLRQQYGKL